MIDRLEQIWENGFDLLTSEDLDWLIDEIYDLRDEIMNMKD